jgi:hypothetical protein
MPRSAEYSLYLDDEEPTKPGGTEPAAAVISRVCAVLTGPERKRLAKLAEAWLACNANQRALLEAAASEFAQPSG